MTASVPVRDSVPKKAVREPVSEPVSPAPQALVRETRAAPQNSESGKTRIQPVTETKISGNTTRKSLSGIKIVLDDDSGTPGHDAMDKDFQEF